MENSLRQLEGYEIQWMEYAVTEKDGRVFHKEIAVLPICAIKPCGRCFECGMAEVRRRMRR